MYKKLRESMLHGACKYGIQQSIDAIGGIAFSGAQQLLSMANKRAKVENLLDVVLSGFHESLKTLENSHALWRHGSSTCSFGIGCLQLSRGIRPVFNKI